MKKTLLTLVAIMALALGSYAQWITQNSNLASQRGITDMFAVDANIVWAAAYDGVTPTNPCQDVTHTINGGTLWTANTITGATSNSIANIVAVDGQKAWAITYYPSGTGANDGVWYTSNGGTTWTHQTSAPFSNASSFPDCVHFWDANVGWCMGDPINGDFEIYTTTNGGTTWTAVPGSQIPNPLSGEFGIVGYYSVVGNTVWFGTNMGRIYKSIDQGHNWTVASVPSLPGYIQPFFRSQDYGFAMNKDAGTAGELAVTTDGGTTWNANPSVGNVFTNDMAYIPGTVSTWITTGADVTNSAAGVTYSFDDGVNWIDMTSTIGTQFLATAWVNDSTGWAGAFVDPGPPTSGGMYKFDDVLAGPVPDFSASDTAIVLSGSIDFTNLSLNGSSYLWTFEQGNPPTSTLTNPTGIIYSTPGSFDVTLKVTNVWGSVTKVKTDYIYVGGLGINDQSKATIAIYPNPVTDFVNVQATAQINEVSIYNLVGQVVLTQKVNNNTIRIATSGLKHGVYNLRVTMDDGFINKKIVVN